MGTSVVAMKDVFKAAKWHDCYKCGGCKEMKCKQCKGFGKVVGQFPEDEFDDEGRFLGASYHLVCFFISLYSIFAFVFQRFLLTTSKIPLFFLLRNTQTGWDSKIEKGDTWPCRFCRGRGTILCTTCMGNGGEISPYTIDWSKFSGTKQPFQQYARRNVFDKYYGSPVEPAYLEVKEYERLEKMDKWVRRKEKMKNPFNKFYVNVRGIAGDQHMGKVKPKLRKYVEQVQERLRRKDEKFGVKIHAEESAKMAAVTDKKKKKKKTSTTN